MNRPTKKTLKKESGGADPGGRIREIPEPAYPPLSSVCISGADLRLGFCPLLQEQQGYTSEEKDTNNPEIIHVRKQHRLPRQRHIHGLGGHDLRCARVGAVLQKSTGIRAKPLLRFGIVNVDVLQQGAAVEGRAVVDE